jgi:hypothetical protein
VEKTREIENLKREMADQQQNLRNMRIALSEIESMLRSDRSGKRARLICMELGLNSKVSA